MRAAHALTRAAHAYSLALHMHLHLHLIMHIHMHMHMAMLMLTPMPRSTGGPVVFTALPHHTLTVAIADTPLDGGAASTTIYSFGI